MIQINALIKPSRAWGEDNPLCPRESSPLEQAQALDSLGVGTWEVEPSSSVAAGMVRAETSYRGLLLRVRTSRLRLTFEVEVLVSVEQEGQCFCSARWTIPDLPVDGRMLGTMIGALERLGIKRRVDALAKAMEVL